MQPLAFLDSLRWWSDLTSAQQLFYGIGIIAGIVTLIMAVLGLFGLGDHDSTDAVDHFDGGSIFSTKPLTGFFLGFGWAGGIALEGGLSLTVALIIALGSGVIVMLGIAALLRAIFSLRSDGTRNMDDAIGAVGTVYVTLPPARAQGGQINVTISGRLETVAALNAALRPIPSGEKVKVVGLVDAHTVMVEPI